MPLVVQHERGTRVKSRFLGLWDHARNPRGTPLSLNGQELKGQVKELSPEDLDKLIHVGKSVTVIDVRTLFEFRMGHIPGAINRPLGTFRTLKDLAVDGETVFVCESGVRSASACHLVGQNLQAQNLAGGMAAWRSRGLPLQKDPRRVIPIVRQAHFIAGLLLLTAFVLYWTVSPSWIALGLLPMFGLLLDATTGICPVSLLLKKMPWNKAGNQEGSVPRQVEA